jgi:hypothetical protein
VFDLVVSYYFVLREMLRSRPDVRPCLTRCQHCRIFFLSHPRNLGRKDLGCPFGCRDAHRRQRSTRRSVKYNRTEAGKMKKAQLNARRRQAGDPELEPEEAIESDEIEFDPEIVTHIVMVTSLIEGFAVSRRQVVAMLRQMVRQHSIFRESRRDYLVRWLREHPP